MSRHSRARSHRFPTLSTGILVPLALAALCVGAFGAAAEEAAESGSQAVKKGSTVAVEYTLTLEDGTEIENNVGGEALSFEQGSGQIIPGLDKEVLGMKVGESKKVTVSPEEAYGPINPEAFQQVPVSDLPEDARVAGTALVTQDAQGRMLPLRVDKIEGEVATLDFNHPLAGKTLVFDFKIVEIH